MIEGLETRKRTSRKFQPSPNLISDGGYESVNRWRTIARNSFILYAETVCCAVVGFHAGCDAVGGD